MAVVPVTPVASRFRSRGRRFPYPMPLAAALSAALASSLPAAAAEQLLPVTSVTATRSLAQIDDLSVTVTAIGREEMNRRLPVDEADLFRDEPDVAMARDLRRHGATTVNIRGIEDNRIVHSVDGVRMADAYDKSGPTNYVTSNPLGVMPDFLRQVEIVRGPASSLYGSDALGGVVGYLTLDPADLLRADARRGLRVKTGWSGDNAAWSGSAIGALRSEAGSAELLMGWSQIRSHEFETRGEDASFGPMRSQANPLRVDDRGGIAKLILKPAKGHRLTATVDGRRQQVDSEIKRHGKDYANVRLMQGDDKSTRLRSSVEYEHMPASGFYDRLTLRLSQQRTKTDNQNFQQRGPSIYYYNGAGCSARGNATPPMRPPGTPFDPRGWINASCDMLQDFQLEQTQTALSLQLESGFHYGRSTHLFTYGVDVARQEVETRRDGKVTLTSTLAPVRPLFPPYPAGVNPMQPPAPGTVTHNIAGELYPLRDFPNGNTDSYGIFVQDEMHLLDARLMLTPGIRYDRNRLAPEMDALAANALGGNATRATAQSYGRISPKLGWQWKFTPALATYGQLASGFRAPNYNEVNGSFRNLVFGYGIVPNPGLKPETSVGLELGLRARGERLRGQVALYDNRYKDFIESDYLDCPRDPACIPTLANGTLQSQNLSRVRIYGLELRGSWDFAPGWRVDGAIAHARGRDEASHQPLDSVEPLRASFGLAYVEPGWGVEGRLRAAARKSRIDSRSDYFRTPGYGVLDLAAWVRLSDQLRVNVSLNNLLDKKYWMWSDIRHMDVQSTTTALDFYSQPGRQLRVALQADF